MSQFGKYVHRHIVAYLALLNDRGRSPSIEALTSRDTDP